MIPLIKWPFKRPGSLIPVFFLCFFQMINGQLTAPGVESEGLAGCSTMLKGSASIAGNQAGLGWNNEKSLLAEYTMPLMMKEMGIAGLSLSLPLYHGNAGVKMISGGIPGYRDQSLWLSYGLRTGENFTLGAGLFYNLISIRSKLNHQFRVSFAGGVQVKITEDLLLAGHILYPFQYNSSRSEHGGLKASISLGGYYAFYAANRLFAECRFTESGIPVLHAGIESTIGKVVKVRGGYKTKPASFSFGCGFRIHRIRILFASNLIFNYGLSSSFGLNYEL